MQIQEAMEKTGFLMPAQSRMLAVGLRQGSGDRVCEELANRLMEQADETLENTVAKIEPAMVLLASALVGMILLSVMLPLMNIMSAIG
jgi:type IV pilus assembly protein PilC